MSAPSAPSSGRRSRSALLNYLLIVSMLVTQMWLPVSAAAPAPQALAPAGGRMNLSGAQAAPPIPIGSGGLHYTLSEGSEQPGAAVTNTVAAGEALSAEETQALLDRLPPLEGEAEDVQEFRLPVDSLPPPSVDTRIETSFPPTQTAPAAPEVESGNLEVLRFAPEGELAVAPFLQVTFNQPMVALGTLEQLAAEDVPVTITPQLPGVWKWLGTKTLTFEYKGESGDPAVDRFPMATEYSVEIPEGTTSATGGALQEAVRWTFSTPAPRLLNYWPSSGPQRRDPLFFAAFDQLVDPPAVLNTLSVTAGGEEVEVRLAAAEEVAADSTVSALARSAGEGRWIAFRATSELPADSTINVNVGPNTPSVEGPLVTAKVQSWSFQTYAALRVVAARCAWGGDLCPPGSPYIIEFNNPIDATLFDPAWVTLDPAVPGTQSYIYGATLQVMAATAGRSSYKVTVSGQIQDIFGQTLGEDAAYTFRTDEAFPWLTGPYGSLLTLDPAADPVFTVYSVNYPRLRARAFAVTPDDWKLWLKYQNDYWNEPQPTPPGELVLEETIEVQGESDALTETSIDLSELLGKDAAGNARGHLIVVVDIPQPLFGDRDRAVAQAWVQATDIAIDAFSDAEALLVWTTSLSDGTPKPNVTVDLYGTSLEGQTAADGRLPLNLAATKGYMLVASTEDDLAILPRYQWDYWGDSGWGKTEVQDELRWFVFDDRQMYRPGEEVHLKGWVRRVGMKPDGDVGMPDTSGASINYEIYDPQYNMLTSGSLELNALGGFDFAFTLPENANLGYANVTLRASGVGNVYGTEYYHTFQIQEFRRPEFSVTAQPEGMGPWFLAEDAVVSVGASYFAGGPLPSAETTWTVNATAGSYSPPNWPDFSFGTWTPWWRSADYYASESGFDMGFAPLPESQQSFTGYTDPTGKHYLRISFDSAEKPVPYSVTTAATVMDVNRQAWSSSASLLVHPSELYVGLRSDRYFVEAGDPLEVEVIVTDVDGNAVPERTVTVTAARQEWQQIKGRWQLVDVDVQECPLVSGNEPESCSFETATGGEYIIRADVRDDRERLNRSELTRWVAGGKSLPRRTVEQESVQIIPDKETYADGDVAELLVQSPFGPAEGLMTVARNGFLYTERFTISDGSITLRVPIQEAWVPNVTVKVDLTGSAARVDDKGEPVADVAPRPAYAAGQITLQIPPVNRTLMLESTPDAGAYAPGDESTIAVTVTDSSGAPVEGAELAVVVVDEAILALTGYSLADPLATFYRELGMGVDSTYGRASVILVDPAQLAMGMGGGRGGGGGEMVAAAAAPAAEMPAEADMAFEESAPAPMPTMAVRKEMAQEQPEQPDTPIAVRTNFNPLALFAPAEATDAEGRATVTFTLPDNLTRYRVMVVAVLENKFGSSESNITARLPLMVRPSAPRFLNFGDVFEFPVVIQNQTDEPLSVSVAMTAANLTLSSELGQRVEVPANNRIELRFPASAQSAGTARFQVAAAAGDFADAANGELPVYTPATTEAFAVYGVVDEGAIAQPLMPPTGVFPQFGGLEVNTSSTALSALSDAVLYLYEYPFECSEQIASRVMGIAALRDVLTAFNAEGLPSAPVLNAQVESDVAKLATFQNNDGGFPAWTKGKESIPYYSIFVAHALQMARLKDYRVPDEMLSRSLEYLRNIESYYPSYYSEITRRTLSAYALYVRDLMGDTDTAKAREWLNARPLEQHSLEAVGWIWQVLAGDAASAAEVEAIRTLVSNSTVETAGAANFFTSYGDQAYLLLHSNRRTDAILLDALINDQPESDLIPKLVNGLLGNRNKGRWDNTQENVWVLLALDRYFNTFENVEPDFIARVWLGEQYVAEHPFEGYTNETRQTLVPMQMLTEMDGQQEIIVGKEGDGRLYYRLGLKYAPTDLTLDPLEMGFTVLRTYEAVDDPADVQRDEDGTWRFKAGARVRVRITMVAENRRYHVALVDPMPAGMEAINPALAVSEPLPGDPQEKPYGWWWYSTWYEHQNLRDSRAEAFTSLLWDGVYEYTYVARATTPGTFVVPPAKAEEMYSPEVFGRSASDRVIVE